MTRLIRHIIPSWLVLGVLAASFYLPARPADSQTEPCASALGQVLTSEGGELASELEILSWNIQKASNLGWAEDLADFGSGIDLAFIQEASVQAQIGQVIPVDLYQAFAAGYTTQSQETGVMTLSTSSPSVACNLTSWEPWLGTPKATSITEYPLQGRDDRLLTINLHAVNFALGLENFQAQFDALTDVLRSHQGPVILAGDLNTWSDARQLLVDNFMLEHGLAGVAFEPDLRTTTFGHALDHIYVRGMRAEFAQSIPVSSSDHNPLRVRLTIQ
jgi:endonuclease/exonuclease/phosphatase (EEP) superfamily protein YafD